VEMLRSAGAAAFARMAIGGPVRHYLRATDISVGTALSERRFVRGVGVALIEAAVPRITPRRVSAGAVIVGDCDRAVVSGGEGWATLAAAGGWVAHGRVDVAPDLMENEHGIRWPRPFGVN